MAYKCARCGDYVYPHRWLTHDIPVKKTGIGYLITGYETWVDKVVVCDKCSDEYKKFLRGEAIAEIQKFDRCPVCKAKIEPKKGIQFCSSCGAKIKITKDYCGGFRDMEVACKIEVLKAAE